MIDPEQQAELRARFNPDGSDLRKLQLRMLEMLKYIDKVCRENDITYWLSSGTCLGAVRHGGFIPWDDDVDIEMLEKDYRKLRKVWKGLDNPPFVWQDHSTDPGYTAAYAKIRDTKSHISETNRWGWKYKYNGVYIDVFHLQPSSSLTIEKLANTYHWWGIWMPASIHKNWVWNLIAMPSHFLFYNAIVPVTDLFLRIGAGSRLRHATGTQFTYSRNANHLKKCIRVPFEDSEFPIPEGYDGYLTQIYGDYMKLPDVEEIHPHTQKVELY